MSEVAYFLGIGFGAMIVGTGFAFGIRFGIELAHLAFGALNITFNRGDINVVVTNAPALASQDGKK